MTAQLIDLHVSPNGKRYTPEEREAAYLSWKIPAQRSLRKAAEMTGISASTLGTWHQQDGWVERAKTEDDEAKKAMRLSIQSLLLGETTKSVKTAIDIRDNEAASNRDRLQAAQWIAGLAGVAPVQRVESAYINLGGDDEQKRSVVTTDELRGLSPDELSRREEEARARSSAA